MRSVFGYKSQVATRAADATRLNAAGILSEFDIDLASPVVSPYTNLDLRGTMDAVDAAGHSWIGWAASSLWLGNGTLHVPSIRELARPYPRAVAGSNVAFNFTVGATPREGSLTLSYDLDAAALGATEVFVSTGLWWAKGDLSVRVQPVGAVQWEWEDVDGVVLLPDQPATSCAPAPFAHSFLRVTAAQGRAGGGRVTVVVVSAAQRAKGGA